MKAMAEQMKQPEMQEQLQEAQALLQSPAFVERVEKLKVLFQSYAVPRWCFYFAPLT